MLLLCRKPRGPLSPKLAVWARLFNLRYRMLLGQLDDRATAVERSRWWFGFYAAMGVAALGKGLLGGLPAVCWGLWWLLARPSGGEIGAVGNLVVRPRTASPAVGSKAYPSRTPTLASAHGPRQPPTVRCT